MAKKMTVEPAEKRGLPAKIVRQSGQLQAAQPAQTMEQSFRDMARDPKVSIEKLERLMALWERGEVKRQAQEFGVAMSAVQRGIPTVFADKDNNQTSSRYASYPALDRVVRPIYSAAGFSLSFDTRAVDDAAAVRVICYVAHVSGHVREYQIDMPADGKGAKGGDVMTKTHATGSAVSYGMRYLLKMIFNIAIAGERDDDGNRADPATSGKDRRNRRDDKKPAAQDRQAAPPARSEAPSDNQKITMGTKQKPGQVQRLWVIIRNSGRNEQTIRDWLHKVWGYSSSRDIIRRDYDAVCRAIEAQDPLPDHK